MHKHVLRTQNSP